MSNTVSVVRGLVSVVSEACRGPTEQDSAGDALESLVVSTRETFRPRSRTARGSSKPKFHLYVYNISSNLRDVSYNHIYS